MAEAAPVEEQHLKQRAMRRLALALGLIALAIVGLAVLDRYSRQPAPAAGGPAPANEPPAIAALPPPKPIAPPPAATPAPSPDAAVVPPPPPPSVDESDAESRTPATGSKAAPDRAESARPAPAAPAQPTTRAPASAKPPPSGMAPAGPPFVVQLGMFSSIENAQALLERLKAQGVPAYLETRVVVGPFRDRAEADAAQRKLQAAGVSGVIAQRK